MRLPPPDRRCGNMLVLFALLTFVLFGVAALTCDLGNALLARRQLRAAAVPAALEGLRFRDELPPAADPATALDEARRQAAAQMAAWVFDDSTRPAGNPINLGAGPVLDFSGGVGLPGTNAQARETVTVPDPPVYRPRLKANPANDLDGDLVSGAFALTSLTAAVGAGDTTLPVASGTGFEPFAPQTTFQVWIDDELLTVSAGGGTATWTVVRGGGGTAAAAHAAGALVVLADRARETGGYVRNDFVGAGASPAAADNDAFLVRLRRTNETADPASAARSQGPPVPFLFGRAALLPPDVRARGITVRATAIAQGSPVVAVGRAIPADAATGFKGLPGAAPFALKLSVWVDGVTFPDGARTPATVNASGTLTVGTTEVGTFFTPVGQGVTALGQTLPAAPPPASLALPAPDTDAEKTRVDVYIPLYDTITVAVVPANRVVAFGYASLTTTATAPYAFPLAVTIRRQGGRMAAANATAGVVALPVVDADVVTLLGNLSQYRVELLLTPVVVR